MRSRWTFERRPSAGWAIGGYFVAPASGIYDRTVTLRCGRTALCASREREGQPWPEVSECHSQYQPGHTCPQHTPDHGHVWAAGKSDYGPGIPVRCVVCGARKCDRTRCILIRHHDEQHCDWLGYNGEVASSVGVGHGN